MNHNDPKGLFIHSMYYIPLMVELLTNASWQELLKEYSQLVAYNDPSGKILKDHYYRVNM